MARVRYLITTVHKKTYQHSPSSSQVPDDWPITTQELEQAILPIEHRNPASILPIRTKAIIAKKIDFMIIIFFNVPWIASKRWMNKTFSNENSPMLREICLNSQSHHWVEYKNVKILTKSAKLISLLRWIRLNVNPAAVSWSAPAAHSSLLTPTLLWLIE